MLEALSQWAVRRSGQLNLRVSYVAGRRAKWRLRGRTRLFSPIQRWLSISPDKTKIEQLHNALWFFLYLAMCEISASAYMFHMPYMIYDICRYFVMLSALK